mgnify:CR=1 FL=1
MAARGRELEVDPINLTPLLDCILNLIFFFLLATTIKEEMRVITVEIPQAGVSVPKSEALRELVVTVGADGRIFFKDDFVTSAQLKTRVLEAYQQGGKPLPVLIRSDKTTPAQPLVDVMSVCKDTSAPSVGLAVRQGPGVP